MKDEKRTEITNQEENELREKIIFMLESIHSLRSLKILYGYILHHYLNREKLG